MIALRECAMAAAAAFRETDCSEEKESFDQGFVINSE